MKFIGYWKYDDPQLAIDAWKTSLDKRNKHPDNYPKTIFGPFQFNGGTNGFTCFEVDKPEQITYLQTDYEGVMTWEFYPIIENQKTAEIYMKNK